MATHVKYMMYHQGAFLQAPFLFPEKRYHFMVCGYAAGKTSALASIALFLTFALQGKRDYEGRTPRILLGGINLGHLLKTTVAYIKQDLENADIAYEHNKKDNILTIGDVDIIMVSLSDPNKITGYDVCASLLDELDDLGSSKADDTAFEAMKSVNERTRQGIKGFRNPFIMVATTSQGQRGLYRIYTQFKKEGTGFTLLRGRTQDNVFIQRKDPTYVPSLYKIYNKNEALVYLEGQFLAVTSGRVFPDFDWDRNYADVDLDLEIGQDEQIYFSMDFNSGYCRATAFVLRGGILYGVKYYDFPDPRNSPAILRHDFPRNKILFIPDATATKEVLSYLRELRKYDITWISRSRNPNAEDSVFVCLAKTSLVLTFDGKVVRQRRVDKVRPGMYAFTRNGWKRVLTAKKTGRRKTIYLNRLRLTGDHEVLDEGRWVQAQHAKTVTRFDEREVLLCTLKKTTSLLCQDVKGYISNTTGYCGTDTQTPKIRVSSVIIKHIIQMWHAISPSNYTNMSGLKQTVRFLKDVIYTMWMETRLTTLWKISCVLQGVNTYEYTESKVTFHAADQKGQYLKQEKQNVSAVEKYTRRQPATLDSVKNTIRQKQEKNMREGREKERVILSAMQRVKYVVRNLVMRLHESVFSALVNVVRETEQTHIETLESWKNNVLDVEKLSEQTITSESTARTNVVMRTKETEKEVDVYDIEVEDEHEFLSQGIIVHNCNKLLHTGRLIFTRAARETAEACAGFMRDKNHQIPVGKSPIDYAHAVDGVRYACTFLVLTRAEFRDIRRATIGRRMEQIENESAIEELPDGYVAVRPTAM